jgi:hypothetical protein
MVPAKYRLRNFATGLSRLSLDFQTPGLEQCVWRRGVTIEGTRPMPNYEICYRDDHGALAAKVTTPAPTQLHAKILAHAMKEREYKTLEVWDGDTLIYERAPH